MYRTQLIQEEVKENLMNNRMFFDITHKEFTKQNRKGPGGKGGWAGATCTWSGGRTHLTPPKKRDGGQGKGGQPKYQKFNKGSGKGKGHHQGHHQQSRPSASSWDQSEESQTARSSDRWPSPDDRVKREREEEDPNAFRRNW